MAKKAKRATAGRTTNRKAGRAARSIRTAKRAAKKAVKGRAAKAQPNRASKPAARPAGRKTAGRKTARPKATARKAAAKKPVARKAASKPTAAKAATRKAGAPKPALDRRPPTLDRARRTVAETETRGIPSSLDMDRKGSAARTGRAELREKLHEHTSSSPALTAGDIDADWESAEAVGDEAPGGDNPTPDQDVVDEIGKALGVEYDDDEELLGGDEIRARDKKRWELDPASSDDFDDRD